MDLWFSQVVLAMKSDKSFSSFSRLNALYLLQVLAFAMVLFVIPAEAKADGTDQTVTTKTAKTEGPRDMNLFNVEPTVLDEPQLAITPIPRACRYRYDASSRSLVKELR